MQLRLVAFCLLAQSSTPAHGQARADLLDFSSASQNRLQLIGPDSHRMVPESEAPSRWSFEDGVLTASPQWDSVVTPKAYGDFRMHLEFNVNAAAEGEREARGNSGVYIQQRYELQILDSFDVPVEEYEHWDCGSLYRLKEPDQIAVKPPGEWQSYDILFRAARFTGKEKSEDARVTVFLNDRLIHDDVAISRKTGAGKPEGPKPLPIKLQGHHNQVGFRNAWIEALDLEAMPSLAEDDPRRVQKLLPRPGKVFGLGGRTAFLIEPSTDRRPDSRAANRPGDPRPWVWYAPTLPRLPGPEEGWMFDRLLAEGISIAGIDVGESYGSPAGRDGYDDLYAHMTGHLGFAQRPVLLARSRGGLMMYSWATLHPDCVAGIAGIYPVCDIASYPGVERAAPAYGLTAAELGEQLTDHNPMERLEGLAAARVAIHHIHGDSDGVVPLGPNSAELQARYSELGGPIEVEVVAGGDHDMWSGWFESATLLDFMVRRARATLRVAACQILVDGDREAALERIDAALSLASAEGAQIACFPEACLLGWVNAEAHGRGEPLDGRIMDRLCALAREHRIMVAVGLAERSVEGLHNSAVLIDRDGELLLAHRKVNIMQGLMEPAYVPGTGAASSVVQTRYGRIGLLICADTFEASLVDEIAQGQPDLVLVPYGWAAPEADWPGHGKSLHAWISNTAKKTGAPVLGVDSVGSLGHGPWTGYVLGGQSALAGSDGEIRGVLADREVDVQTFDLPAIQ